MSEVGRKLKKARAALGLSLEEAAKRAKLAPEHLSEVEEGYPKPDGGRRMGPTLVKLERIGTVYGMRVNLEPTAGNGPKGAPRRTRG